MLNKKEWQTRAWQKYYFLFHKKKKNLWELTKSTAGTISVCLFLIREYARTHV